MELQFPFYCNISIFFQSTASNYRQPQLTLPGRGSYNSIHHLMPSLEQSVPLKKLPLRVIRHTAHNVHLVSLLSPVERDIIPPEHLGVKVLTNKKYLHRLSLKNLPLATSASFPVNSLISQLINSSSYLTLTDIKQFCQFSP